MASLGKLMLGFFVLGICIVGAVLIISQSASTPYQTMNIGNSDFVNGSSMINQTAGLVTQTTSFGTGTGIIMLFIVGAMIVLAALALIVGRTHR